MSYGKAIENVEFFFLSDLSRSYLKPGIISRGNKWRVKEMAQGHINIRWTPDE